MLKIREFTLEDFYEVDRIYKKFYQGRFDLPRISESLANAVITDEKNKIISFAMLQNYTEGIMVTDMDMPIGDRVRAVHEIMARAIVITRENGGRRFFMFSQFPGWTQYVKDHFGFEEIIGTPLVLEIK